ncbi:MAG: DsrE family protein [Gammaproteobacteria bacterium]|nr:DsrE family protein [Gammaproteobacteria bacterium]
MPKYARPVFIFSLFLFFSTLSHATTLDDILKAKTEPDGIVIEIVTGDATALEWALPQAQHMIKQIHQRWPNLHIAIVTHGTEQFALQKSKQNKAKKIHKITKSLVKKGVQLHVCGTHASWKGVSEEDFPDYVDVASAAPATINDYRALGYKVIVIDSDD